MFDYMPVMNVINCLANDEQVEQIRQLKDHFKTNINWQLNNKESLIPITPKTNNPEIQYIPKILNKIKNHQLTIQACLLSEKHIHVATTSTKVPSHSNGSSATLRQW